MLSQLWSLVFEDEQRRHDEAVAAARREALAFGQDQVREIVAAEGQQERERVAVHRGSLRRLRAEQALVWAGRLATVAAAATLAALPDFAEKRIQRRWPDASGDGKRQAAEAATVTVWTLGVAAVLLGRNRLMWWLGARLDAYWRR